MKVTIITVAYNSANTLADTMRSVLNQTYKDIEYIVVDGNSQDSSTDIIRSFEPLFGDRLKWVSEKDEGIYDAMNKGVRMATGDIVGILNSDDLFTSDTLIEQMVGHFPAEAGAIYGDIHFFKGDRPDELCRYYSGRIFRPWLVHIGFLPPHPSLYVRRELFSRYGCYDPTLRISADFEFIARLSYKHHVVMRYLPIDFVAMRMGGASTLSWSNRLLGAKENLKACKALGMARYWMLIAMKYPVKFISGMLYRRKPLQ